MTATPNPKDKSDPVFVEVVEALRTLLREFNSSDFWSTVGGDRWDRLSADAKSALSKLPISQATVKT
jgi:hypothetical protein